MNGVRLDRVRAGYGRTTVLRDVDLVVPAGKTVALLGANGAGKTTLLQTVAGLVPSTAGRISLGPQRIDHLPEHTRAEMGLCLIPEGKGVFRQLSVRDNLAMFAIGSPLSEAIERAVAAFPILGARLYQEAGTLSGGQQQMLALSRALVTDASVIMADELSLGLAPVIVDEIFEVLERFRSEGRALLIVEQFVDRALAIADYVYILHKGAVAFVGEPAQCQDHHIFEQYVGATP